MIAPRRLLTHFASTALVLALAGCDDEPTSDGSVPPEVTPFHAQFSTQELYRRPDPTCGGGPPLFLSFHAGEGVATPGGPFTIEFSYCIDVTDLVDDGQLTAGESLPFDNLHGTLVLGDGDELYVGGSGTIVPCALSAFDLECHDRLSITGGTGQFALARGTLSTDDYIDEAENEAFHDWRGTVRQPQD